MAQTITRTLATTLSLEASDARFILIDGMPGVGKTTLARSVFSDFSYIDLADIQARALARTSPEAFYTVYGKRLVIDSIDLAPQLALATPDDAMQLIFVGQLPLEVKTQLTENRGLRTYHLTPLSLREIAGTSADPFGRKTVPIAITYPGPLFLDTVRTGFLPRTAPGLTTRAFYEKWLNRFFDKTVQSVMKVEKTDAFLLFLKAIARHNLEEINHSRLATDCHVSYATAIYWTQFLLDCGVLIEVPSLKLSQRRQVKRSKVAFADMGLLCYLLDLGNSDDLLASPHYHRVFSGFVASEIIKGFNAWGEEAPIFFYRDTAKKHIDLLLQIKNAYLPLGFFSKDARPFEQQLREMQVLSRMGEKVTDPVFFTDGTREIAQTDYPMVAASSL